LAVSTCAPLPRVDAVTDHVPVAPATVLPTAIPLSNSVTTSPASPTPLITGVVTLVRLSPATPLSEPGASATPLGAGGTPRTRLPPCPSDTPPNTVPDATPVSASTALPPGPLTVSDPATASNTALALVLGTPRRSIPSPRTRPAIAAPGA